MQEDSGIRHIDNSQEIVGDCKVLIKNEYTSRSFLDCPDYHQLVPKKKAKSPVWDYYGLPADESGQILSKDIAICNSCQVPVSAKSGSTTNLMTHMKVHHPVKYREFEIKYNESHSKIADGADASDHSDKDEDVSADEPPLSSETSKPKGVKNMYRGRRSLIECPDYHQLVSKKNTKSIVWNYYGLPGDESGQILSKDIAICKCCKAPVASKCGSTSNLMTHIKVHHRKKYREFETLYRGSSSKTARVPATSDYSDEDEDVSIDEPPLNKETGNQKELGTSSLDLEGASVYVLLEEKYVPEDQDSATAGEKGTGVTAAENDLNELGCNSQALKDTSVLRQHEKRFTDDENNLPTKKIKLEHHDDWEECLAYSKTILFRLMKLESHDRQICMHEIDNVLFEAYMKKGKAK